MRSRLSTWPSMATIESVGGQGGRSPRLAQTSRMQIEQRERSVVGIREGATKRWHSPG